MTGASARDVRLGIDRVRGATVSGAEARGKHLLLGFERPDAPELVLHTHLGMKGSWRVRSAGRPWGRPPADTLVVIETGDHHAACWAPVIVRLVSRGDLARPGESPLPSLGPDALIQPFDMEEVLRRAALVRAARPDTTIGELLLDQSVASGIGNVYRCEALFVRGVSPFAGVGDISDEQLADLFGLCASMLRANLAPGRGFGRDTGGGTGRSWVHRRAGLPCRRCRASIRSSDLGRRPRRIYWCPKCQPFTPAATPPTCAGACNL